MSEAEISDKVPVTKNPDSSDLDQQPVSIFDLHDDGSLINMVSARFRLAIERAAETHAELFIMDEIALTESLRKANKRISAMDNRLRLKFWTEYDRAKQNFNGKMNMASVHAGICTNELFYNSYIDRPDRIAWLCCPPINYGIKVNEALEFGIEQLRDILALDHGGYLDDAGLYKPANTKLIGIKVNVVKMLDERVRGAIVQKSVNVQMTTNDKKLIRNLTTGMSEEQLKAKLHDLQLREKKALHLQEPQVIDIEAKSDPVQNSTSRDVPGRSAEEIKG